MNRAQLEHIIRAAGTIADDNDIVVIGSQSILGQFPEAPAAVLVSMEADVYPRNHPERADMVDGSIGEGSPFHETFGYYAQGVGPETATLPNGWEQRLIEIRGEGTRGVSGWCLEVHDLLVSKAVAGRPKDKDFVHNLMSSGLVDPQVLRARLNVLDIDSQVKASAKALLGIK